MKDYELDQYFDDLDIETVEIDVIMDIVSLVVDDFEFSYLVENVFDSLDNEQLKSVYKWAYSEHLVASDNKIDRLPRPKCIIIPN